MQVRSQKGSLVSSLETPLDKSLSSDLLYNFTLKILILLILIVNSNFQSLSLLKRKSSYLSSKSKYLL